MAKAKTNHAAHNVKVADAGLSASRTLYPPFLSNQNHPHAYHDYPRDYYHVPHYRPQPPVPSPRSSPSRSRSRSPPPPKSPPSPTPPGALMQPGPPRSAFICFKDHKKKEIKAKNRTVDDRDDTLGNVAGEWRKLTDKERAYWDEQAREDKVRFVREKAAYKGPWNIPKRRAKKHPLAPKRPMSAFLKFSKTRRNKVKQDNPSMENTDVSRLLGEMWRNASTGERAPYVESEEQERAEYKEEIKKWRSDQAQLDATSRTRHQSAVQNYQHHQLSPPSMHRHSATYDRSHAIDPPSGNFENLNADPLLEDHSSRRSAFRPHYQNHGYFRSSYQPEYYARDGHNQPLWHDLSLQHSTEQDSDPLPVVPTRMHPPAQQIPNPSNEDYVAGHYASRSNYYSDMPHYSRYI